ncbi:DUF5691 domain-containing protein [Streptomyces sp. NPDC002055]|uniref:DUF5691 domain-containing protein n=1 Tax=Streptomyces sp. NPDC002055 TaxID=3154534 RepID=UPI003317A93B
MSTVAELHSPAWEELVTAALLGTERRTPPVRTPGREPAVALLDAAAVVTVRRRAGLRPATALPRPGIAPEDRRPPLPPAARHRLATLLADRAAGANTGRGRRGTAPDLTELLPQWLAAAHRHGYRTPDELLPALLDTARARSDLRPQALALAGPRALWLARLNPDWKFALRGAAGSSALPDTSEPEAVHQLWEEGLFAERVTLLAAVRHRAPSDGLALLGSTWATERAEDRLMFLDSLRGELSAADEPFLEAALSDRSRNVRATAAELLSALPGSALALRMAERACRCVGPASRGGEPVITVEPPQVCDAAMERDGVVPKPPSGRGARAWWLSRLIEATPLSSWAGPFGGRSPEEIVALPAVDDWRAELHSAWCRAAVRQRNGAWARALLGSPSAPSAAAAASTTSLGELAKLLSTLPAAERAAWVAEFIAAHGLSEAFQLLGVCAVPWDETLGRAVVDALDIARDAGSYPWSFSGVMGLAERCLDPAHAERLEVLTAIPDETEGASPGAGGYWSEAFQRLVGTLRLRATMRDELQGERTEPDGDGGRTPDDGDNGDGDGDGDRDGNGNGNGATAAPTASTTPPETPPAAQP